MNPQLSGLAAVEAAAAVGIALRPLGPDDLAAFHRNATHPEVAPGLGSTPFDPESTSLAKLTGTDGDRRFSLGAFVEGRLAGQLSFDADTHARRRHAASFSMNVHPAFQRRGIGSALLATTTELADQWLAIDRIDLKVHGRNARAQGLYAKHGFIREVVSPAEILDGGVPIEAWTMARVRPGLRPAPPLHFPPRPAARVARGALTLRSIQAADAAEMARLCNQAGAAMGTLQLPTTPVAIWEERLRRQAPATDHQLGAWLTESGGRERLVGALGLHGPLNPRLRHLRHLGMSVDPALQGQGIGSALMEAAIDLADHHLGLVRIDLEVFVDNLPAQALYARFGFRNEGTKRATGFRGGGFADTHQLARLRP